MARNKFDVDEALESPFNLKHLKRAGIYVKKHTKKMILAFTLSAVSIIVFLLDPKIFQYAVDVSIPNKDIKQLLLLGFLLMLTIVVNITLTTIRMRIMAKVSQSIIHDIRNDLFAHLQKLPFEYYDSRPHGKIFVRVVNYVNSVSDVLSNGIVNIILEIFNLVIILIFMLVTSVKLTFIALAGMPVFIIFMIIIKPIQRRAWQGVSAKSSNLSAYLSESLDGAKITKVFGREKTNRGIFAKLAEELRKVWMRAIYSMYLVPASVNNITTWVLGGIYFVGMAFLFPIVSFGTILAMASYSGRFWQPILNLSNIYNSFINAIAYLERIFETMDEPAVIEDAEDAKPIGDINGDISFRNVTFSYDGEKNILENVSFEVKAGESIALVGPTGAGKTTIINLISRFYNLDSGSILIDGKDISKVTLKSLRSQMGIMMQESFIFSGNIKDNILYGKPNASDEEIKAACKAVLVDGFISEMKDGYETEVQERGNSLSQGQKQLISFARTLLANPKILILDEATSSIDTKTERDVQTALSKILKGRTSFIIAHRLSTIKNCDKIMYISDLGIKECGTHDELMSLKGDYYKLYTS